jgi:hypothetical protein
MSTGSIEVTCTSCSHTFCTCPECQGDSLAVNDKKAIENYKGSEEFQKIQNDIYEKAKEQTEKNYIPLLTTLNTTVNSQKKDLEEKNIFIGKVQSQLAEQSAATNKVIEEAKAQFLQNAQQIIENERLKFQLEQTKHRVEKESLIKKVEELNQKLSQGSMQSQGEAGEELVKENLVKRFSDDNIGDIGKGKRGADLTQQVNLPDGTKVATILIEVKNTSSFSHGWIAKGKEDQQAADASFFILVTKSMPKDITHFGFVDGVLVTSFHCYLTLVALTRQHLIALYQSKQMSEVKDEIPGLLYEYVTSNKFIREFENLFQIYSDSKDDLDKEKKTFQKFWNGREQSLNKLLTSVDTLYTGCKEIVGTAMPIVDGLE